MSDNDYNHAVKQDLIDEIEMLKTIIAVYCDPTSVDSNDKKIMADCYLWWNSQPEHQEMSNNDPRCTRPKDSPYRNKLKCGCPFCSGLMSKSQQKRLHHQLNTPKK